MSVNTFGTGMIRDETLAIWLEDHVDMRPGVVIRRFGLTRPLPCAGRLWPFGENGRGCRGNGRICVSQHSFDLYSAKFK